MGPHNHLERPFFACRHKQLASEIENWAGQRLAQYQADDIDDAGKVPVTVFEDD